jgi:hypothetical protein
MKTLADRSPGLVLVLAAVAVYGTILVEIGMWMVASWIAMFATLALAAGLAVAISRWFFSLVSDDDEQRAPATVPVAATTVAAPRRETTRRRAPRATALPV